MCYMRISWNVCGGVFRTGLLVVRLVSGDVFIAETGGGELPLIRLNRRCGDCKHAMRTKTPNVACNNLLGMLLGDL